MNLEQQSNYLIGPWRPETGPAEEAIMRHDEALCGLLRGAAGAGDIGGFRSILVHFKDKYYKAVSCRQALLAAVENGHLGMTRYIVCDIGIKENTVKHPFSFWYLYNIRRNNVVSIDVSSNNIKNLHEIALEKGYVEIACLLQENLGDKIKKQPNSSHAGIIPVERRGAEGDNQRRVGIQTNRINVCAAAIARTAALTIPAPSREWHVGLGKRCGPLAGAFKVSDLLRENTATSKTQQYDLWGKLKGLLGRGDRN